MKNKFNLIIFTAVFSLSLMYLIVPSYVYDEVMKEIPIKDLATYVFLGLFFLSLFIIKAISKKVTNHGKMLGICLVFWGICVTLIPTLSINLFLMLSPLTKINTHSLNLTYTVAGLSALVAIGFAGVVVSLYNLKSTFQQNKLDFMIVGVCGFIGSLIVYYVVPNILSYDLALYLTGGLLFATAIMAESIKSEGDEIQNEVQAKFDLSKALLVFMTTIIAANFTSYFYLNELLSKETLVLILILGSLAAIIIVSRISEQTSRQAILFLNAIYLLGCILIITNIIALVIIGLVAIVIGLVGSIYLSSRTTVQSLIKFNMTYTIPIVLGYFVSNYLIESFGELVSFTERRFYFIPSSELFIISSVVLVLVLVLNFKNAKGNQ